MVKKALKWLGIGVGGVVAVVAAFLAYVQVTGIPRYPHATPVPSALMARLNS